MYSAPLYLHITEKYTTVPAHYVMVHHLYKCVTGPYLVCVNLASPVLPCNCSRVLVVSEQIKEDYVYNYDKKKRNLILILKQ